MYSENVYTQEYRISFKFSEDKLMQTRSGGTES